jgi:hypothetical protein
VRRFLLGFLLGAASIAAALPAVGHYLDVTDPLAKADAIVAISGDTGARRTRPSRSGSRVTHRS